jgi:RHS repeat-associated protein
MVHASNGTQDTYFTYDAAGQRVRKVYETNANLRKERIYLGSYEIYREIVPTATPALQLQRDTIHVMDGVKRIAMVETLTRDGGLAIDTADQIDLFRYQLDNHLGSACLELDGDANVISYEEYSPYGSTSYRASKSGIEVSARRYRYTGKERDEETGLYYYGARYYAAWLGRWTSADPLGLQAGVNLYLYCRAGPVRYVDPDGMLEWPWQTKGSKRATTDTDLQLGHVLAGATSHGAFGIVGVIAGAVAPEKTEALLTGAGMQAGDRGEGTAKVIDALAPHLPSTGTWFAPDPEAKKRLETIGSAVLGGLFAGAQLGSDTVNNVKGLVSAKNAEEVGFFGTGATYNAVDIAAMVAGILEKPPSTSGLPREAPSANSQPVVDPVAEAPTTSAVETPPSEPAESGPVQPYEVGTYEELQARSVKGDRLDLDHQPSHASNLARAEAELGRELTPAEIRRIRALGTAVAVPEEWHRTSSPTYGGRNTPGRITADAADPVAAATRDSQAMVEGADTQHRAAAERAAAIIRIRAGM